MCFGGSSIPAPAPVPPPPAPAPQLPDQSVQAAGDTARARALAAIGPAATILTGPQGLVTPPQTAAKSLLGL